METQNLQPSLVDETQLGDPKPVAVTNNLTGPGTKAELTTNIVVISAKNNSDKSSGVIYGQDVLTMLAIGNNTYTIAKGSSGTIHLSDPVYNLIHAESKHLYPVKVVAELQDIDSEDYPPITVAQADLAQMQLAERFNQVIASYPDTNMAQDWQDTVTKTYDSANNDGDIEDAVAAFFQRYPDYATLDLNSVTALSTYYKKFAFPWTTYQDSYTFYLYSTDGNKLSYQGKLDLNRTNAADPASVTDENGGYTIQHTSPKEVVTNLIYNKGQFVSSLSTPSIVLQCLYVAKSALTQKSDDNFMIPVVSGTVNGIKVIGSDTSQDTSDGGDDKPSLFNPKTAEDWVILMLTLFGIAMSAEWVIIKIKQLVDKYRARRAAKRGEDPSSQEVKDMKKQINDMKSDFMKSQQQILDRLDNKGKIPDDFKTATDKVNDLRTQLAVEDQRAIGYDKVNKLEERIETAAKFGVDPTIENIQSGLIKAKKDLGKGTTMEDMKGVHSNLDSFKVQTDQIVQQRQDKFSKQEKIELKDNEIKMEEFVERSNQVNAEETRSQTREEPKLRPEEEIHVP